MIIPTNVIFPYSGTHASIPTNWSRDTSLDGQFIKAWGTASPSATGGASSHSHTGDTHTHTETDTHGHLVSYNYDNSIGDDFSGPNTNPIPEPNHKHEDSTIITLSGGSASDAVTYPSTANNNHPPYSTLIFIKAGTGAVLADGTICLWNSASIPTGYLMAYNGSNGAPALGNTYLRGATTGANSGTTGGSLTHTHDLTHTHSTSHSHTGESGTSNNNRDTRNAGSGSYKINQHSHSVYLNATTVSTDTYSATLTSGTVEPLYKKLIALYKNGGATIKGIIGIWTGSVGSVPRNWLLCNGQMWADGVTQTPDLQNYFVKIANATGELGNTGGANTHSHAASNAHTHSQSGTHTHTGGTGIVYQSPTDDSTGGWRSPSTHSHTLASVGNNNATLTWGSATMSAQSASNEPQHTVVAFIQLEKIIQTQPRFFEI